MDDLDLIADLNEQDDDGLCWSSATPRPCAALDLYLRFLSRPWIAKRATAAHLESRRRRALRSSDESSGRLSGWRSSRFSECIRWRLRSAPVVRLEVLGAEPTQRRVAEVGEQVVLDPGDLAPVRVGASDASFAGSHWPRRYSATVSGDPV